MSQYTFTYTILAAVFGLVWLLLFLWRKDTRKQMLIFSAPWLVGGPLADVLYTIDWWSPPTVTGTQIGIESVFAGFFIGGIAAVLYEQVFRKKILLRKENKLERLASVIDILLLLALSALLLFGIFILLENSLWATIFAFIIPTLLVWRERKDLVKVSIVSGFLFIGVACVVYWVVDVFTPGWVLALWHFKNVPEVLVLSLPLDDLICYFCVGLFIGPLYEYAVEGKITAVSTKRKSSV